MRAASAARLACKTIFGELWARDPGELQPFLAGMFEKVMHDAAMAERINARLARARKPAFRPGDFVECVRSFASVRAGTIYVVEEVHANGFVRLEWQKGVYLPCRFRFVKRAAKQAELDFGEFIEEHRAWRREVMARTREKSLLRSSERQARVAGARALSRAETWNAQHPPRHGSLDEYGPLPEKPNPIFNAIDKTFPTHRGDIAIALTS